MSTILVDAGGTRAAIFTVNGQDYDITTFTGRFYPNASKFDTPCNGGVMPWWGNATLAQQFATTVLDALGEPNRGGSHGPFLHTKQLAMAYTLIFTQFNLLPQVG
ncbi:MAG: hypothetical protein FJ083_16675 [Cyanobacteria bacterium K_Offshore_surface_m2_239]|nr:hypothetical protein [Cyanobacteria bacterium K_Offshore_surface_m2_239]